MNDRFKFRYYNGSKMVYADLFEICQDQIYFAFNKETELMQCTGLKKSASFREEEVSTQVYSGGHHLTLWSEHYNQFYEVIGNIYENKELLEEYKDE